MAEEGGNAVKVARMVAMKVNFILERQRQMYDDDGVEVFDLGGLVIIEG